MNQLRKETKTNKQNCPVDVWITFWLLIVMTRVRSPSSTNQTVCGYQLEQVGILRVLRFLPSKQNNTWICVKRRDLG